MSVINVRKKELNKQNYRDLEHWLENDNHVYIGRNLTFYVKGAKQSIWANKFSVKKYGREECLKKYKEYITRDEGLMKISQGVDFSELCITSGATIEKNKDNISEDIVVKTIKAKGDKLK